MMLMWVAFGLIVAAAVIGAWCLISALWPNVGYGSVNDPTITETRITCWAALSLFVTGLACAFIEAMQ